MANNSTPKLSHKYTISVYEDNSIRFTDLEGIKEDQIYKDIDSLNEAFKVERIIRMCIPAVSENVLASLSALAKESKTKKASVEIE